MVEFKVEYRSMQRKFIEDKKRRRHRTKRAAHNRSVRPKMVADIAACGRGGPDNKDMAVL